MQGFHILTGLCGIQGGSLPMITATVVILATLLPTHFAYLAPAADTVALLLMQVFFTVLGASGSIWDVINTAPSIFFFALVQIAVHLALLLSLGKLFRLDLNSYVLLASNANVGGPTTAGGMARSKGWDSLGCSRNPCRHFGVAIAALLGIGFGMILLRHL